MATLIDTHCHLNDSNLAVPVGEAIRSATEVGVTRFIVPGTDLATSHAALDLAVAHPGICFAAVGVHPHEVLAQTFDLVPALDELRSLVASTDANSQLATANVQTKPKLRTTNYELPATVVAVGEIGIDYHHHTHEETGSVQREAFAAQLSLATEHGLPAIVHGRDAYEDVLDVIRAHPGSRGVLHSFEAPYEVAAAALDLGWVMGFTALVTYRGNDALREVVAKLPADAFMLETDTPYLPPQRVRDQTAKHPRPQKPQVVGSQPVGARGRNNQPAFLLETAQVIADVRRTALETVAAETTRTATRFFGV